MLGFNKNSRENLLVSSFILISTF